MRKRRVLSCCSIDDSASTHISSKTPQILSVRCTVVAHIPLLTPVRSDAPCGVRLVFPAVVDMFASARGRMSIMFSLFRFVFVLGTLFRRDSFGGRERREKASPSSSPPLISPRLLVFLFCSLPLSREVIVSVALFKAYNCCRAIRYSVGARCVCLRSE